ncbi:MAG TPA: DEAD/DEAH box helicase [Kofleriaceae bacterium]|nr:DEAD/DEAH box helicase [Kofleriaceae bacterium]
MPVESFHPVVQTWFRDRFGTPTEPQALGWPHIAAGEHTLIAAPTGSGKTLAAFLACLNELLVAGLAGELPDRTQILYVSPLKALSNDIHRNLEAPLAELREVAARMGLELPPIRVAVRTGDTPASERQKMAKTPPHILVTTPESLFILLTAERSREALSQVRTVIVDEIHAVAGSKRGAHLTLSLERLERLVTRGGRPAPVRVGLSATQRPIELIGQMLVGARRPLPFIVDAGHARTLDLAIEITDDELGAVASHEQFDRMLDRIAELTGEHQSTIVFVNTRKLVEKVAHQLEQRLGEEHVVAHHGSMSRKMRFAAEQKLKYGRVRCAVATASLELGIDVGAVDLVVQIGSPRAIATLLQRIGRSGHSRGATPKGRLFALTRDQLVECAALVRAMRAGTLDAVLPLMAPLDILAQQIVASVACEELGEDELFELMSRAWHYGELERKSYDDVLTMLSEGIADRRGRANAHVFRDRVNGRLKGRRGARIAAITSGGAIPDNNNFTVVQYPDETPVGSLEEDFALESMAGDVFLLGNTSWRVRRVEAGKVIVDDARGAAPTIPFWLGEAPARTVELCHEVGALRAAVETRIEAGEALVDIAAAIAPECTLSRPASEQMIAYMAASRAALGALPTTTTIIAERFFDETGGMQMLIHAPLGGRINRAWGLALRKRFCRSFNFELQAAATDDGLILSLGQPHSFPLEDVFGFLRADSAREVLVQAMLDAPMFEVRWRWNTTRALAVLRRTFGKRVPPHLVRMRCNDLLSVVFPMQQACLENVVGDIELPDHPLVNETVRDCLSEAMDVDGLVEILRRIECGEIRVLARDTVEPSPIGHEIINANPYAYLDDAGLDERRTRAVQLRRGLSTELASSAGALDPDAIGQAEDEARPEARDADELHDALLSLHLIPEAEAPASWAALLPALIAAGRATVLVHGGRRAWVAAERLPLVRAAFPAATCEPALPPLRFEVDVPDPEHAVTRIAGAQLDYTGPRTAAELAAGLGLPLEAIDLALLALESDGAILRGTFRSGARGTEWCNRRILARIHRLTLARLRREIEPVNAAALMRFLFRWQRVGPGDRLIGAGGLERIIEQLQGFESAAGAWEREILPARLHDYDPTWLDMMCLGGVAAWCRVSARTIEPGGTRAPTRAAPLALMLRQDLPWLRAGATPVAREELGEPARAVHDRLAQAGASFLPDLAAATTLEPSEVEDALWELVAAGLATADGWASLRVLVDRHRGGSRSVFDPRRGEAPKSQRWQDALKKARRRDHRRPAHAGRSLPTAAGRWSLLSPPDPEAACAESTAQLLLARYGVVFRDLLARETGLPPWRDILVALRRMEARGEIRGGRFVAGFVGEQFALPEAAQALRASRHPPRIPELVRIAATDPVNLVGVTSPGPRVPAVIGNAILYRDGVPIASLEAGVVVPRHALEDGARVDDELGYHPPPRAPAPPPQLVLLT